MEPSDEELSEVGGSIRETLDDQLGRRERLGAARQALLEQVATRRRRGRGGRLLWAAGVLCVGGSVAALLFATSSPITFRVGPSGLPGRTDDLIAAGASDPVALAFSEGSAISVEPGSRVRVLDTVATGARVLVENGGVDVAVVHRPARKTSWRFELGPFRVLVTGTKFHAGWNATSRKLALSMQEGSVEVSGDCITHPRRVVGGERLEMSCPASTATEPALGASPVPTPLAPSARTEREPDTVMSWRGLLASGHLRDALRAAEGAGFDRVCRVATGKELLDLSDAARLSGKAHRAAEALGAVRRRFPRSPDAANAAFAMGKVAYEQRRAYDEAVRWFAIYLDEQPNGFLMGDAVGRLMEARYRSGDTDGARVDAERYLRRFPGGPYTREATSILAKH